MKLYWFAILSTMLIGCTSPEPAIDSRANRLEAQRPSSPKSQKLRHYLIATGLPAIATSLPDAKDDVVIYVTPSCPACIVLFTDLTTGGLIETVALERAHIAFVFVPRVQDDYDIITNLFCIEPKKVFPSVATYFKAAREKAIHVKEGADLESLTLDLVALSSSTARSFGVPDHTLKECQESFDFSDAITAAWQNGWKRNPYRDWPLVIVNGRSTFIKTSAGIVDALKE
jgi:hypothetical protein